MSANRSLADDDNSDLLGRNQTFYIILGILAGIGCGLFFGDHCQSLKFVADGFVNLLQMTVLPFLFLSLVSSIGKLSRTQSTKLLFCGSLSLALLWCVALFTICVVPGSFPEWKTGSFFSDTGQVQVDNGLSIELFIPSNIFSAFTEGLIPSVVIFSLLMGIALIGLPGTSSLIQTLDTICQALSRINHAIVKLMPFGVFVIIAEFAGTATFEEFGRLQTYLIVYTVSSLFLAFVVLPFLVTTLTDFSYVEVMKLSRRAMLTALATGKLILAIPILISETDRLLRRRNVTGDLKPDALYPIAYPFPHIGKLLGLLFIPFAAWFMGSPLDRSDYFQFLPLGLVSYFGGPIAATPYLLDQMHLPHDMFKLFLASSIVCGRIGDAVGVVHLVAFSLITISLMEKRLRLSAQRTAAYFGGVSLAGFLLLLVTSTFLTQLLPYFEKREEHLARLQILDNPAPCYVLSEMQPNPTQFEKEETTLDRIRRRQLIRVGFNPDKIPFAYFNGQKELVGHDVNLAHELAHELEVGIEFVPFDRERVAEQFQADHFDIIMSGLIATPDRAEKMHFSNPHLDLTLALLVPDYEASDFRSGRVNESPGIEIGVVEINQGFVRYVKRAYPRAKFVSLPAYQSFVENEANRPNALVVSAETASAFSLMYPDFEIVIPPGERVAVPIAFAMKLRDFEFHNYVETWLEAKRKDGTLKRNYDHWVLGKSSEKKSARWSIAKDLLGWLE